MIDFKVDPEGIGYEAVNRILFQFRGRGLM
jgi:hypothetical protein